MLKCLSWKHNGFDFANTRGTQNLIFLLNDQFGVVIASLPKILSHSSLSGIFQSRHAKMAHLLSSLCISTIMLWNFLKDSNFLALWPCQNRPFLHCQATPPTKQNQESGDEPTSWIYFLPELYQQPGWSHGACWAEACLASCPLIADLSSPFLSSLQHFQVYLLL